MIACMIETLATTLVANFLLPHIKDLMSTVVGKVAEDVGDAAGQQAASALSRVWDRVTELFGRHPERQAALEDFKAAPDDEDAQSALRLALKKLLEAEPEVEADLAQLVDAPVPGTTQTITQVIGNTGVTVIAQGNTMNKSTIGGNVYGPPPTTS
jgi:hemophore-related protein